jgi:hypothetical protein
MIMVCKCYQSAQARSGLQSARACSACYRSIFCGVLILFIGALASTPAHAQLYTKVSNAGHALPASATLGDGPGDWACTLDERSGLMWEVKRSSGLRAASHNYSWLSGGTGNGGNTASCGNTLAPANCNTQALVNKYNDIELCGSTNWRLPSGSYSTGSTAGSSGELAVFYQNLFNTAGVTPASWYPNTRLFWHWTSVQDSFNFGRVWLVNFGTDQVFSNFWDFQYPAMLVTSDGPSTSPPGSMIFASSFEAPGLQQGFDDLDQAGSQGWLVAQRSNPEGSAGWFSGNSEVFPSHSGSPGSYVGANYDATGDTGTISLWLISPLLDFRTGSGLVFHTRTTELALFPDRVEVRACSGSACNTIPLSETAVGDFTISLGTINPNLEPGPDPSGANGYPGSWTRFEYGAADGLPQSGQGRIAFRYFVPDAGASGVNSNYIGIDSVTITAAPAE